MSFPNVDVVGPATYNAANGNQINAVLDAGYVTINSPTGTENAEFSVRWTNPNQDTLTINFIGGNGDTPFAVVSTFVATVDTHLKRGLARFIFHDSLWRLMYFTNFESAGEAEFGGLSGTFATFAPGSSPTPVTGWSIEQHTPLFSGTVPNTSTGVITVPTEGNYELHANLNTERENDKKEFSMWMSLMSDIQGNIQLHHQSIDSDKTTYNTYNYTDIMQFDEDEELRLGLNWEGAEDPDDIFARGRSSFWIRLITTETFSNGGLIGT